MSWSYGVMALLWHGPVVIVWWSCHDLVMLWLYNISCGSCVMVLSWSCHGQVLSWPCWACHRRHVWTCCRQVVVMSWSYYYNVVVVLWSCHVVVILPLCHENFMVVLWFGCDVVMSYHGHVIVVLCHVVSV